MNVNLGIQFLIQTQELKYKSGSGVPETQGTSVISTMTS